MKKVFGGVRIAIHPLVPNGDHPTFHLTEVDLNRNFDFLWSSEIGIVKSDGIHLIKLIENQIHFLNLKQKKVVIRHIYYYKILCRYS